MIRGSERRAVVIAFAAVIATTTTGCPGRRPLPPPRPTAQRTVAATATPSARRARPTPTRTPTVQPGPPSQAPPSAVESLPAGAPTELVAAARMTEAAKRDLDAGETDRALETLERAVQVGPTAPFPYYYMAVAYLARGRADEALVLAQRAATLSPGYPSGWAGHSHVLRGRAFESLGRHEEARRAYLAALGIDPNNIPARRALADLPE